MHSPVQRDLVGEFVTAVRAAGLRVGFYHSLLELASTRILPSIFYHPMRNSEDVASLNRGRSAMPIVAYLHGQVRELFSN